MSTQSGPSAQLRTNRSHPVPEDMAFQRASWRAERCGWLVMGVVGVLALLGLFANGPLSTDTARDAAGRLEVRYDRFARNGATMRMQLRVSAGAPGETVIRIAPSFAEAFSIQAMQPRPIEQRSGPDGAEMVFRSTSGTPFRIHFDLLPERSGLAESEIAIAGTPPARFTQFVFP